jgi:hypothetical protein
MTAIDHAPLVAMLDRLKLTAIRDQLDALLDEAARSEMTLREALRRRRAGSRQSGTGRSRLSISSDEPNMHDILTGTLADGTKAPDTCGDWTMGGAEGAAMLGHHDRAGRDDTPEARSWNAAHPSRGGCSMEALQGTGGAGLFYCFATD